MKTQNQNTVIDHKDYPRVDLKDHQRVDLKNNQIVNQ